MCSVAQAQIFRFVVILLFDIELYVSVMTQHVTSLQLSVYFALRASVS